MRVLVIGSGGREHALCWAIAKSPKCSELHCAPGNAGISKVAVCVPISADDFDALLAYIEKIGFEFVVVGPEAPLVDGLGDRLAAAGVKFFGPSRAAAQLEGSKGFTKDFCTRHDIPTAGYGRFSDAAAAKDYIRTHGAPIVVKADGLAAGKGVIMAETEAEALAAIDDIMEDGAFGSAGAEVVLEEWMVGEEASLFAITDGTTALPLASAQDHKRVGDGDTGPNTGGMGAYSPAPVVSDEVHRQIMDRIITPTVRGMAAEGNIFRGVLYAGLMITKDGPKLIEYNVRFGDPECQALVLRLESDFLDLLLAAAEGRLADIDLKWSDDVAVCVVMAANGYPGSYEKGTEIGGLDTVDGQAGVTVFHAGTGFAPDGKSITATGGRVLGVTALGGTIEQAQKTAYGAVDQIDWPGGFCRRDIAWRAIERSG